MRDLVERGNEIPRGGRKGLQVPVVSWWGCEGLIFFRDWVTIGPLEVHRWRVLLGYLHVGLSLSPKAVLLQQKIDKPPSQTDGVHSLWTNTPRQK